MTKASIVGAGLIGRAWAVVFARAGWEVSVWDPDEAARTGFAAAVAADVAVLERAELVADAKAIAARITVAGTLDACLSGTSFVQENGPEKVEVKTALFRDLDALAPPDAILASSTSAIVASLFTEELDGRARCLVGHPVNPPHLIPLVEVCGAPWTDSAVVERAMEVYRAVGQTPVTVHKEVEGFVLNRLQGALLAEAFRLVEEGVVSAEDLDLTLTDGLARRWSFIGPLATIELNAPGGIPDYCARYTGFYKRLAASPAGPDVYEEAQVARLLESWPHAAEPERLASRAAWRNTRLAALAAHIVKAPKAG